MQIEQLLPGASDAGNVRGWYLPLSNEALGSVDIDYVLIYGRFLGVGTSHVDRHNNHQVNEHGTVERFVRKGTRCNACRWFETRIFRELHLPEGVTDIAAVSSPNDVRLGDYVVHFAGMSVVDGEVPFCRYETTSSPHMVIEYLTTRRTNENGPQVFLAKPSAHALANAAAFDVGLGDAYVNRAVS